MTPDGDLSRQGLLQRIRCVRAQLAERAVSDERGPGDFVRVSLPQQDGDVLRDLLIADHARSVVEIGLAYGTSALAVAEALATSSGHATHHTIVDPFEAAFKNSGWSAIVEAGADDTTELIVEPSQVALPRFLQDGLVVDAAFVDGSHIFHNVFVDLYYLRQLVRPGGLIILDDVNWPSVDCAVRYFEANTSWQRLPIVSDRLRALRLPQTLREPAFEDFRPFWV